ncbi:MAG: hypothetical protein NTZ87_03380 [Candidatus Nomurabacteria bacterium]|nr:hypothetical protein [Candidatus Nomurabacteria bacterium]
MNLINHLIIFTHNPKYKMLFFLSPFIFMIIGFAGAIIFYELNLSYYFLPIFLSVVYFCCWIIIMYIRTYFQIGENGKLTKSKFQNINDVYDKFRIETKKYGWDIIEKIKTPLMDYGFIIKGIENDIRFELEISTELSGGNNIFPDNGIYMNIKKGDKFNIKPDDLLSKTTDNSSVKQKLIISNRVELYWLMRDNNFISRIEFGNGSMAVLLFDYYMLPANLKKVLSNLALIAKSYDSFY